uniref:BTB domain-containing protein n=1 Tax=Ditylenchus dipsaci TaxID=166011 RepID=A0A915EJR8_9BILA
MSFASTQDQCNQKNQCTYDDFSIPVRVRQDRIIVDGKTLFVNLGYLAVNALPIFCPQRKRVTSENIDILVKLAHDFDMEHLLKRCEEVIEGKVDSFSTNRIVELTQTLSKHNRYSPSMSVLMDKLARLEDDQLNALPFDHLPGNVVADLYAVKLRQSVKKNGKLKDGRTSW